jgi:hypothetical protein
MVDDPMPLPLLTPCRQCGKLVLGEGEAVTISAAEYQELWRKAALLDSSAPKTRRGLHSPIDHDPELAAFLVANEALPVAVLRERCRSRFGDRVPSATAVYRFLASQRRRAAALSRGAARTALDASPPADIAVAPWRIR